MAPTLCPDLTRQPASCDLVTFAGNFGHRFLLTVDTEEEFDWSAPFDRASRAVTITREMEQGQRFFAGAGVRPLYVTDYPVITDPAAGEMMARWVADGQADVGAHLHPWVNPPDTEQPGVANSFAGNLPADLERDKLTRLRDAITATIGRAPLAYRAGRYGIGPHSGRILRDLGFRVDTSVRSRFDYSAEHGPDFTGRPLRPYWVGSGRDLLELPLSTAFVGALAPWGDRLFPVARRSGLVMGGLARLGLLQRVPLTPEGVPAEAAKAAISALLGQGQQLFLFSFHSPTLAAGHTPYSRTDADVAQFYRWWDEIFAHLAKLGIAPVSLDEVIAATDKSPAG